MPAAPDNKDAIIIDVTEGTLNINSAWAYMPKGAITKLAIRTQNGSSFNTEIFDCTNTTAVNFANANCDGIGEDEFSPFYHRVTITAGKKYKAHFLLQRTEKQRLRSNYLDMGADGCCQGSGSACHISPGRQRGQR